MKRNYGIDVLKIMSMLMVMSIHVIGQGGVITHIKPMTATYDATFIVMGITSCAVNCFAIVTGYLMYPLKFKLERIIKLWFQVSFYGLFGNLVLTLLGYSFSIKYWIQAIFPVMTDEYWYFTAYFGMFFFIPFMNILIKKSSKKQIYALFLVILISICGLSTINDDIFQMNRGWSMWWLVCLYLLGAGVRKLDLQLSKKAKRILSSVVILSMLIPTLYKIFMPYLTTVLFGRVMFADVFRQYTSPFNMLIAVALLMLCSNMKITNRYVIKGLTFFSPLMFGCYLIQVLPAYYYEYLHNAFLWMIHHNMIVIIIETFVYGAIFLLVLSLIDYGRQQLFKVLKINQLASRLGSWLEVLVQKSWLWINNVMG